jgi:addiction module HigA family antidote
MRLPNIHPGEILLEEFMEPHGISQNRLGRDIGVSPRRINEIVHGKRSVTADTAIRLGRYFGTSAAFWTGLQSDYDIEEKERQLEEGELPKITIVQSKRARKRDKASYMAKTRVSTGERGNKRKHSSVSN